MELKRLEKVKSEDDRVLDWFDRTLKTDEMMVTINMKIGANNGYDLFHIAAKQGHLHMISSTFDLDIIWIDKKGQTALHMAVKGQNMDIVAELIKPDPTIVKCLLSFDEININVVNKAGETPLDIAENLQKWRETRVAHSIDTKMLSANLVEAAGDAAAQKSQGSGPKVCK
ncbi:Ankyrin repeat-containing protein [Artemisia annua]|uniref:Ankyrin repeat-containing protein n=1 Tax=Artemisia annua TaxID=35608 RepID=A0A2U1NVE4_ARTAN|nr:Ankyrin repeat-containing protein [Artemisia annua]